VRRALREADRARDVAEDRLIEDLGLGEGGGEEGAVLDGEGGGREREQRGRHIAK